MNDEKQRIIKYIGGRCRYFRKRAGFSIENAAALAGVTSRTLYAYERGDHEPTMDIMIRLAEIYKTTLTRITNYRYALDDIEAEAQKQS